MSSNNNQNSVQNDLIYAVVELGKDHPVPISWNSGDESTGYARILLNKNTFEIYQMEMIVDGMFVSGAENLLEGGNPVQPFHFHNQPQGGPNFIVQQLFDWGGTPGDLGDIATASLVNTDTGFSFTIDETYAMRPPVNNPGLGLEFVFDEIEAGNAYLGIHTNQHPIPQTPIAGDIVALGNGPIDGEILWLLDDDDVAFGGRNNDLLSLGGGDDTAWGRRGDDIMDGGAGDDELFGGRGDDDMWGGDGNDLLAGGRGDDRQAGNRGNDILLGNRGDDIQDGGDGEDLLNGGRGNDLMTGGKDGDIFQFGRHSGDDVITDFVVGEDSIALTGSQRIRDVTLADLDDDGFEDDTLIDLRGGTVAVLDADLASVDGWLM